MKTNKHKDPRVSSYLKRREYRINRSLELYGYVGDETLDQSIKGITKTYFMTISFYFGGAAILSSPIAWMFFLLGETSFVADLVPFLISIFIISKLYPHTNFTSTKTTVIATTESYSKNKNLPIKKSIKQWMANV